MFISALLEEADEVLCLPYSILMLSCPYSTSNPHLVRWRYSRYLWFIRHFDYLTNEEAKGLISK